MNTFKMVKEIFDEIYGSLITPVVLFDNEIRLIKVNQSFINLTKARLDDLQTHSLVSFFKELKVSFDGQWNSKDLPTDYVSEIVDIEGNSIPVRLIFKKLKKDDGLCGGAIGFITDLGEMNAEKEKVKKLTIENDVISPHLADEMADRGLNKRKKLQREMGEKNEFLKNIFRTTADGIMVTDHNGSIVKLNRAAENITGYREDELIEKHITALSPMSEEHRKRGSEMTEKLYSQGYLENWEDEWQRKDGRLCPVEFNITFLRDTEGNLIGSVGAIRDITDRKRSEEKLKETKDQLDNIIESSLDAIVVSDLAGYVTRTNNSFLKLLGYKEEEIIGKHIMEFLITKEGTYESTAGELVEIKEEFFNKAMQITERLFEEGKISNWESYFLRKDKKIVPIEMNIVYLCNEKRDIIGSFGISRDITNRKLAEKELKKAYNELEKRVEKRTADLIIANEHLSKEITERKQTAEQLRETKEQLESFIETSLDSIVICDNTGRIIEANKAFLEMLGFYKEEVIGNAIYNYVVTKAATYESTTGEKITIDKAFLKNISEKTTLLIEKGKVSNWLSYYINKENKIIPVNQNGVFLYNDKGERTVVYSIIRDITEQRKTENATEEANRCRNQFFTNISHEFRTPLTLAMGPIEGILRGEFGKITNDLRKHLTLSLQNSRKLLKLINQLLECSRLESGSQNLIYEKRDLAAFIKTILDSFKFVARKKNIDLTFNSSGDTNGAYIDPVKMEKVLFNLIGNAFKFTPKGGRISVGVEKDNGSENGLSDYVKISVSDNGIGIKKEHLTHIFERFSQANGGTAREYGGTGIGLALSNDLIELMNGNIEVESEYSKGSTFFIHLPIGKDHIKKGSYSVNEYERILSSQAEIELSDLNHDNGNEVLSKSLSGTKPLILIVEDNSDMRQYVLDIIKKDYDFITAHNGFEALKRLNKHQPDLILCDIMMPIMDGYEFLKKTKSDPKYKHIPLIFLTARADSGMKVEGLEEGADDYIIKPFNSLELLARVKSSLRIRSLIKENMENKNKIIKLTCRLEGKYNYGKIIGKSKSMRKIYQILDTIKNTDSTVLITGETGTGKEMVANTIHYISPRKDGPFVAVNCGAIPKELMEREFFGHIKGAYTGAYQDKKGYFEEAEGGTIFLDEIGELDKELQVKLLRVLESGEFVKVGTSEPTKIDVRLIAASNKDLRTEVQKGNFRKDLYFRIYVVPIHIPLLRERKEDIPLLIEHFLNKLQAKFKKKIPVFTKETLRQFINYSYPGNVRELEHLVERVHLLSNKDYIQAEDVPLEIKNSCEKEFSLYDVTYKEAMKMAHQNAEKKILDSAIIGADNNYQRAAEKLGISRSYFYKRLKMCGIIESRT